MKMRKLVPLVLLAVGSLFLLTSCDALLDAIFPSNVINLDVAVVATTHADFTLSNAFVNVQIVGPGVADSVNASWSSYDGSYVHYYFTFIKLKNDAFTVYATYYGPITAPSGDPATLYLGPSNEPLQTVLLPYENPNDLTGHLVDIRAYVP